MKMKLLQILGGVSAIIGLMLSHGWGYEEIMVHQGGKIQGKVRLVGENPPRWPLTW